MIRTLCSGSLFILASFVLSGTQCRSQEPEKKEPGAADILDRVTKTYAECETYRDTGEVSITFVMATGDRIDIRPFKTAFVRPDRFRYQYLATNPANISTRYLIWRNGDDVKTWWDIKPGVEKPESLMMALAAATGVSGGSAHAVPSLLMPKERGGFGATISLFKAKRIDDAKLDEVDCYRVAGNIDLLGKFPRTIWIDKKTSLIMRIDESHDFGDFKTMQITTYKPVVGEKLLEGEFAFDPPKPKDD